ncbi:MAG TPA: hypothetical protein VN841_20790 [Bryobacteraceae bacterium]|nr:hypothetical protein [Bryobacteraceae bacterium]
MKPTRRRKPVKKAGPKNSLRFDQGKEVRAIARERVGPVKPGQVIPALAGKDKKRGRKPKHKPPAGSLPEVEV